MNTKIPRNIKIRKPNKTFLIKTNISDWQREEPPYQHEQYPHQQQPYYGNYPPDDRYGPIPPKLPPKTTKKKFLKAPLTAIKNALIKSTKQLRRQNSMVDHERQPKHATSLRRQHSMMEQRPSGNWQPTEFQYHHQQQQYYNERPRAYDDQYYDDRNYQNHSQIYDNYDKRSYYEQENLYANRALIELERKANENPNRMPSYQTNTGTRIMRRHSTSVADRTTRALPRVIARPNMGGDESPDGYVREEIYQTRSGAYMMQQTNVPPPNRLAHSRAESHEEEPIYQSRREMHLDHLYQSKKEMQERIHQGRMEVERSAASESPSSSSAATTPVHSDRTSSPAHELLFRTRKELKEKGFKTRTELRDHIYQTRLEAMETMAEPNFNSSKRVEVQRHQEPIIYESKESELNDTTPEITGETNVLQHFNETTIIKEHNQGIIIKESPLLERVRHITPIIGNQSSCNSSGLDEDETINSSNQSGRQKTMDATPIITFEEKTISLENRQEPENTENSGNTALSEQSENSEMGQEEEQMPSRAMSPRANRAHLSNIIRRVAPPPKEMPPTNNIDPSTGQPNDFHASRTSMETHYTSSQMSLPIGPPNAQSTPFASNMTLENNCLNPPLREQTTTRGIFDEMGGMLKCEVWNVSMFIEKGAIPPGVKQEIYFTVTDPRMSQTVGGPPLDMENGWCFKNTLKFLNCFFSCSINNTIIIIIHLLYI